jgi:transposase
MAENGGQAQPRPEPRRSFTEEFKHEAVRLAIERGNVSAVARDLGINESVLNRWKRQLQQQGQQSGSGSRPFPGNGNPRDVEMDRLRRELARVKQENEILKKASEAIFDGRVGIFTSRPT